MNKAGHGRRLAILALLAVVVQWAVASRAPLVSLDGLRFLRLARWIDARGLAETLERSGQHPLYPMATFGVWKSLAIAGGPQGPESWQRSGRLTAAAAVVLLVIPLYGIGLMLFSPAVVFLGTALFVLLPETARLGADALSDSTYLLFFALAFWAALRFLERQHGAWLFLCGMGSGLAYLARPEGLLLPMVVIAAVVALALKRREPLPWTRVATSAGCLFAGVGLFALPYTVSTGKLTPKSSLTLTIGFAEIWSAPVKSKPLPLLFNDGSPAEPAPERMVLPEPPEQKLNFSSKEHSNSHRYHGYVPAATDLIQELSRAMRVVFLVLALGGIVALGARPRSKIAGWFMAGMLGFFALVLLQFARGSGYIATRHTLTMVALLVFFSASAGLVLFDGLVQRFAGRRSRNETGPMPAVASERGAILAFFLMAALVCLPRSLKPLHPGRIAHIAAGRWLAKNTPPSAVVLDTLGWASWRADRRAYGYTAARQAFEDPRLAYVVAVRKELTAPSARAETLRHLLQVASKPVAEFKGRQGKPHEDVLVFRWHPDRLGEGRCLDALEKN